jgi:excisionase family DNA binding protein
MSTELTESPDRLDLMSPEQIAIALNITPIAVGELVRKRRIPYYRLGWRHIRISLSEVLERSRVPAEKPIAPTPKKFLPKVNERRAEKKQLAALADQGKEAAAAGQAPGVKGSGRKEVGL